MEVKKDNNGPVDLNGPNSPSGTNMPNGPIVLNIENLSIQFGDSNYHDGPEFLGETELFGETELHGVDESVGDKSPCEDHTDGTDDVNDADDAIILSTDEVVALISKKTKISREVVRQVLDAEDEVVTEVDLEMDPAEDEDECSTESHESTVSMETAGHKDVTGNKTAVDHKAATDHKAAAPPKKSDTGANSRSTRSSSSGLLYALVRAITAEELLKDAMREGEDHGDEK